MKPLHIPKGHRLAKDGKYVRCSKKNVNITDKCCMTGKKLYTCKHADRHRYLSMKYDPIKGRMTHGKMWPKDLRDYDEFSKLHLEFRTQADNKVATINQKPGLLTQCMKVYAAWLKDIGVPAHEVKGNSEKYISNEINNLKHLKKALAAKEINADYLMITEFSKHHVGMVHEYLQQYANKTYNHIIATCKALFRYLIKEGYPIKNYFEEVKQLPTKARTEIIELEEFEKLCESVSSVNGWKEEAKGGGKVGRKQMYRDWLVDAWKYILYSGAARHKEFVYIQVKDIYEDHITAKNYKVSDLTKDEIFRLIPLVGELRELCAKLSEGLSPDDYLIAPKEENRMQVARVASQAFSHYWSQQSDKRVILYDLRNIYATQMFRKFGVKFEGKLGLHGDISTTIKNYVNDEASIKEMSGDKLFG